MAHLRDILFSIRPKGRLVLAVLALSTSWTVYKVWSEAKEDPIVIAVKDLEKSYHRAFSRTIKDECGVSSQRPRIPLHTDPEMIAFELQLKQVRADLEKESDQRSNLSDGDPRVQSLMLAIQGYQKFAVRMYANYVRIQHQDSSWTKAPGYLFEGYELNLNQRIGILLRQSPEYKLSYSLRHAKNEQGTYDKVQLFIDPETRKRTELEVLAQPQNEKDYGVFLLGHVLRESLANRWGLRRLDVSGRSNYSDEAVSSCGTELVSFQPGVKAGIKTWDPSELGRSLKALKANSASALWPAKGAKNLSAPTSKHTLAQDEVYSHLAADDRHSDLQSLKEKIAPAFSEQYLLTETEYVSLAEEMQKLDSVCADRYNYTPKIAELEVRRELDPNQAATIDAELERLKQNASKEFKLKSEAIGKESFRRGENEQFTYSEYEKVDPTTGETSVQMGLGTLAVFEMNLPGDAMDPESIADRLADRAFQDRKTMLIATLRVRLEACREAGMEAIRNYEEAKEEARAQDQLRKDQEKAIRELEGKEDDESLLADAGSVIGKLPTKTAATSVGKNELEAIRALVEKRLASREAQWKKSQKAALLKPLQELSSPQFLAARNAQRVKETLLQFKLPMTIATLAERLQQTAEARLKTHTRTHSQSTGAATSTVTHRDAIDELMDEPSTSLPFRMMIETPDQLALFYREKLTHLAKRKGDLGATARAILASPEVDRTMRKFFAALAENFYVNNEKDGAALSSLDAGCSPNMLGYVPSQCQRNGKTVGYHSLGEAVLQVLPKIIKDFDAQVDGARISTASAGNPGTQYPYAPKPSVKAPLPAMPREPSRSELAGLPPHEAKKKMDAYSAARAEYDRAWKGMRDEANSAQLKKALAPASAVASVPAFQLGTPQKPEFKLVNGIPFKVDAWSSPESLKASACEASKGLRKLSGLDLSKLNTEGFFIKDQKARLATKDLFAEALAVLNLSHRYAGAQGQNVHQADRWKNYRLLEFWNSFNANQALEKSGSKQKFQSLDQTFTNSIFDQWIAANVLRNDSYAKAPILAWEPGGSIFKEKNQTLSSVLAPLVDLKSRKLDDAAVEKKFREMILLGIEKDKGKVELYCKARVRTTDGSGNDAMKKVFEAATGIRSLLASDSEAAAQFDQKLAGRLGSDSLKNKNQMMDMIQIAGLALLAVFVVAAVVYIPGSFLLAGLGSGATTVAGTTAAGTGAASLMATIPWQAALSFTMNSIGIVGTIQVPVMINLGYIQMPAQEKFIYEVHNSNHGLTGRILADRKRMKESQDEMRSMRFWAAFAGAVEIPTFRYFTIPDFQRTFGVIGKKKADHLSKYAQDLPSLSRKNYDQLVKEHGPELGARMFDERYATMLYSLKRIPGVHHDVTSEMLLQVTRRGVAQEMSDLADLEKVLIQVMSDDLRWLKKTREELQRLDLVARRLTPKKASDLFKNFLMEAKIGLTGVPGQKKRFWQVAMEEESKSGVAAETVEDLRILFKMKAVEAREAMVGLRGTLLSKVKASGTSDEFVRGLSDTEFMELSALARVGYKKTLHPQWRNVRRIYRDMAYLERDIQNMTHPRVAAFRDAYLRQRAVSALVVDAMITGENRMISHPAETRKRLMSSEPEIIVIDAEDIL